MVLDSIHDQAKDIHADFYNGKKKDDFVKITKLFFVDFDDLFDEDQD